MGNKFTAQVRLTHHYVDSCASMDDWGDSFEFEEVFRNPLTPGNGYDDLGSVRVTIQGDASKPAADQMKALYSTLGYGGCSHEYDCCGCYSQSVSQLKQRSPGLFTAILSTGRNY